MHRSTIALSCAALVLASATPGCQSEQGSEADVQAIEGESPLVSVAVAANFNCALFREGSVRCWGWNGFGGLGVGSYEQNISTTPAGIRPVNLGGRRAFAIAAQAGRVCALLDDNSASCWGSKGYGPADIAPVNTKLDGVRRAKSISVGRSHQCVLFEDAGVKCWGDNGDGRLGLEGGGDRNSPSDVNLGSGRSAIQISAGGSHTCALLDDHTVKCWGGNDFGQLGQGDRKSRGGGWFQMGDHLPRVDLGTGRTALSIAAGNDFTCALLDDGSLKCWGANWAGQLGADAAAIGTNPNEMGDRLPSIKMPSGYSIGTIRVGGRTACVSLIPLPRLTPDHDERATRFACWGSNDRGQLGLGDKRSRGTKASDMGDSLSLLDLGSAARVTDVLPGGEHTCALFDGGRVKCWGMNLYADLGIGTIGQDVDMGDEPGEMGDALPFVDLKP